MCFLHLFWQLKIALWSFFHLYLLLFDSNWIWGYFHGQKKLEKLREKSLLKRNIGACYLWKFPNGLQNTSYGDLSNSTVFLFQMITRYIVQNFTCLDGLSKILVRLSPKLFTSLFPVGDPPRVMPSLAILAGSFLRIVIVDCTCTQLETEMRVRPNLVKNLSLERHLICINY